MREDDQRLLQAIRVGNIGIFDHDHTVGVIYWSPELRRMYGWSPEEPATLPKIIAQVYPSDAERVGQALRRSHDPSGDGLFDIEHRIIDRSGAVRWVQVRSMSYFASDDGPPRVVRSIGAVQDVTERRAAEERLRVLEAQLVHAQKLESIGRLAGGVAHDFNNLLTVISGGIELSLSALASGEPDRAYLADAAEAVRSATLLTRQLLTFSRKGAISPRALDVGAAISRIQKMVLRLLGEDVTLRTTCAPDLSAVWFDPTQLEQIVINLAVNARDAMPSGGTLSIDVSNVEVPSSAAHADLQPGRYVQVVVTDTGVGMTEEVQAHLFEPFFTTKEAGRGTGLGLPMVYGALKQHGGWLEVASEVARGTTVKVYLPATDASPSSEPRPVARSSQQRLASILLVEDDTKVGAFAKTVLTLRGHTVHTFSRGDAALAALPTLEPRPELLITDVVMPGMDGGTLAERVRQALPGLPVLFVSGYTPSAIAQRGLPFEGSELLAKPYSAEQLAERAQELLERAAIIRSSAAPLASSSC